MNRLLTSPAVEPAGARALSRALEIAAAGSEVDLAASGLVSLLMPRRGLQVAAACATLEALAVAQPRLAVSLCAYIPASSMLVETTPARRRQPNLLGGHLDACALAVPALAGWTAEPHEPGWQFRGEADLISGEGLPGRLVAFAQVARGRAWRLHAFLVGAMDLALPTAPGLRTLKLDAHVEAQVLLEGPAAQAAMEQALALRRVLAAAVGIGLCRSAFAYALQVAHQAGSEAAARLTSCAANLHAARLMLRDAAQVSSSGTDPGLLSAMTLLASAECVERVIVSTTQIAGGNPDADPAYLQQLLAARRFHESLLSPSEPQRVLLAEVHPQPSTPKIRKETRTPMTPTSTARPPESADRVGEILDAAADAFTQQSYDATSLDYIGDAIGVTKGSIYYHYRSKADLFMAVYRRAMEMNIRTVEPIAGDPSVRAIDRLYRMAYAHALQVMKHLSYQRVAVQGLEAHLMGRVNEEQRERLKEVIALRDRYEELFVSAIEEAASAGDLPRQSARLAVKPLFGAINWTTMWYQPREGETAADRDRIATHLATFVVSGLTQSHQPVPGQEAAA